MKATSLTLRLVLGLNFNPEDALDAARRFLAMMPEEAGCVAAPLFEPDEARLAAERDADFERSRTAIALSNAGVLAPKGWYGTLYFATGEDGSQLTFTSMLGGSDFPAIWSYMRRIARAAVTAFELRMATLGGVQASADPLADLRQIHVPRVFTPWNFINLRGLPVELAAALRELTDCTVEEIAGGLIIEPVADVHDAPSPSFVAALATLPVEPKPSYRKLSFPRVRIQRKPSRE